MNIIYASEAHGVATCWVAGAGQGFVEDVRKLLDVPDEYGLIALITAGYPDQVPEPGKKHLDEVTFLNRYMGKSTDDRPIETAARVSLKKKLRHLVRGMLLRWF